MNSKAKSKQQIANEYGICVKTLNKWLKRKDMEIPRGLISPINQILIYEKFGTPENS
jgi:CENP-B N-terminal DNA-binding domain.